MDRVASTAVLNYQILIPIRQACGITSVPDTGLYDEDDAFPMQ